MIEWVYFWNTCEYSKGMQTSIHYWITLAYTCEGHLNIKARQIYICNIKCAFCLHNTAGDSHKKGEEITI